MTEIQHMDDITIPDIEIAVGWPVSQLDTLEDCDDAFAYLISACASIEYQIEVEGFRPLSEQRGEWVARAKSALRFKKGAQAIVSQKRSAINQKLARNDDKLLLDFIRASVPAKQWLAWVTAHNAATPPTKTEALAA